MIFITIKMASQTVCSLCNECINNDSRGTLVVKELEYLKEKNFYACEKCVLLTALNYLNMLLPIQKRLETIVSCIHYDNCHRCFVCGNDIVSGYIAYEVTVHDHDCKQYLCCCCVTSRTLFRLREMIGSKRNYKYHI